MSAAQAVALAVFAVAEFLLVHGMLVDTAARPEVRTRLATFVGSAMAALFAIAAIVVVAVVLEP